MLSGVRTVEIIQIKAVRLQFLCGSIFVNSAEIDVFFAVQNFNLNIVHVHRRQQTNIGKKQLEEVRGLGKQQRNGRLIGAEGRKGNASIPKPQKAIAVTGKFEVLIQILE